MRSPLGPLLVMWMVAWIALDAARRQRNWFAWGGLVSITGIFGLVPWWVLRRRWPVVVPRLGARTALGILGTAIPLFLVPLLLTIVITTFWIQVARVEGQAMAPTLQNQDRLLVDKGAYSRQLPQRGDIVMMHYPRKPDRDFVMRVLGGEGDQVQIIDGHVYVNNELQDDDSYVAAEFRGQDDFGPQFVPAGYYFVLGDHRTNSADSRSWGFVPRRYIVGRVWVRWWPLSEIRTY